MKALSVLGRWSSRVLIGMLGLLLVLNLYVLCARALFDVKQPTVFGFTNAVVISGSMSGSIEVDDMVVTRAQGGYEPGDIVLFESGESLVVHRIIESEDAGFVTKGDANNAPDPMILDPDRIVGKVIAVVPGVGLAVSFLQSPLGIGLLVVLAAIVVAVMLLQDRKPTNVSPVQANKEGEIHG